MWATDALKHTNDIINHCASTGSNTATFLPGYPQKGLFFSMPLEEVLHNPSSVACIDIRAFDCTIAEDFLSLPTDYTQ